MLRLVRNSTNTDEYVKFCRIRSTLKEKKIHIFRSRRILLLLSSFLTLLWQCHMNQVTVRELLGISSTQSVSVKTSLIRTKQWQKTDVDNKTAVVLSARFLTNCIAARLHHLAATIPPEIDVWLLHDHAMFNSNSSEIVTSLHHLESLMESVQVQPADRINSFIPGFDSVRSGSAKSAFLRWMTQQGVQYQYAWHVEEDMFYTGLWSNFFSAHEHDSADVVASRFRINKLWFWIDDSRCRVDYPSEILINTDFTSTKCTEIVRQAHFWGMLRVSRSFATRLLEDLEKNYIYGHHEAVVDILLQIKRFNMTFSELQHVGSVTPVSSGNRANMSLEVFADSLLPQRLYHPVKCQAYKNDLTPLLRQMEYHI